MGKHDILDIVKDFSIPDKILLVEAILKQIREAEEFTTGSVEDNQSEYSGEEVLAFAGILDERSAKDMESAVLDSRKIDLDGW